MTSHPKAGVYKVSLQWTDVRYSGSRVREHGSLGLGPQVHSHLQGFRGLLCYSQELEKAMLASTA